MQHTNSLGQTIPVAPLSAIDGAVNLISSSNDRLADLIITLHSRLSPVLLPEAETKAGGVLRGAPGCELEGRLRGEDERINQTCERLADILGRLQL
jgi:hypothetical protein